MITDAASLEAEARALLLRAYVLARLLTVLDLRAAAIQAARSGRVGYWAVEGVVGTE